MCCCFMSLCRRGLFTSAASEEEQLLVVFVGVFLWVNHRGLVDSRRVAGPAQEDKLSVAGLSSAVGVVTL